MNSSQSKQTLDIILAEIRELKLAMVSASRRLLPINEAAAYLGISPKTIRNGLGRKAVKPFPVKPVKIGSRVLFKREDLESYVNTLNKEQ